MLTAIADRFSEAVMAEAAAGYGLEPAALLELDGYENLVYDAEPAGRQLILRIGHSMRRPLEQVIAEVAWLDRLAAAGCPVARSVPARDGRLAVPVPDGRGGSFVAVAFDKAPGVILDDDPAAKARHWHGDLFEQWGRVAGQLHRNGAGTTRRPNWHRIDELANLDRHLAGAPGEARRAAAKVVGRLRRLAAPVGYGLIHADLTQWNFVVDDGGRLTLFDFDSSMRCWFPMDVAVSVYYARRSDDGDDEAAFVAGFLDRFVAGYRSARPLPAAELAMLPDLLLLQTVILYSLAHQAPDSADAAAFLDRGRRRLLGEEPVLELGDTLERLAAGF